MSAVVVRLGKIGRHPRADNLDITTVNGRSTIMPHREYVEGIRAVWIEPGTVVDTRRAQFSWLSSKPRTKVRKAYIRGIPSYGFLIPYQGYGEVGDDVSERLGIAGPPKTTWQRFVSWVLGS
jgi:hypothetical protein